MQACETCHVKVQTSGGFCPLCGTALVPASPPEKPLPQNPYPDLSGLTARYNLILRLLLFFSLLGGGLCVLINLLAPTGFWWSLIVIAGILYLWATVPPLLRRGVNYAKRILFQTLFTSILMVVLDSVAGYTGWSVSFVIPALFSGGITAIGLMAAFNRTNWAQYIFYQVLIGVFGFLPLALYLLNIAQNLVMVLITAGLALASLLLTIVFGDRTLKHDFRRRFHF